jgi:RNA recognition motif-containing protein
MGVHLHVGNLSPQTTAKELREEFGAVGEVADVSVIIDDNGRSIGVAYVQMASAADAARAIEKMDGAVVRGQPLKVEEAERTG